MVGLAGFLVGLTIQYLPGRGGHSPADGLQTAGAPSGHPTARYRSGRTRLTGSRRSRRARSPPARPRQRTGRRRCSSGQTGRHPTNSRRRRGDGRLCRPQLGPWQPALGRFPLDGGIGARWSHYAVGASAWVVGRWNRRTDLYRVRRLDRPRNVLPGDPQSPSFRRP